MSEFNRENVKDHISDAWRVISDEHHECHDGNTFTANYLETAVANNGTASLLFKPNSDKTAHVVITLECEGKTSFKTYSGTTFTSNGTTAGVDAKLTKFNRYPSYAKPSGVEVYYGPTVNVLGSLRGNRRIYGGTGPNSIGTSLIGQRVESIVGPGGNLYIELVNISGQAKDIGAVIDWYEV